MIAQSQQISQKQKQTFFLRPEARLGLYVLQLPLQELQVLITEEAEKNPLLEQELTLSVGSEAADIRDNTGQDIEDDNFRYREEPRESQQEGIVGQETLYEHMLFQIKATFTGVEQRVAESIIGELDQDGFFTGSEEDIAASEAVDRTIVSDVRLQIMQLEPQGVAALDRAEFLLFQLAESGNEQTLAYRLVRDYKDRPWTTDRKDLLKELMIKGDELEQAIGTLKNLPLVPSSRFINEPVQVVVPDAYLNEDHDTITVNVNMKVVPRLTMNNDYLRMMRSRSTTAAAREFLQESYKRANDLMAAIQQRRDTMQRVFSYIVECQRTYLIGKGDLLPLRLQDVADSLGLSVATISRVTANTVLSTRQGLVRFKELFSRSFEAQGQDQSAHSVEERIAGIIENASRRISDREITEELNKEGIRIARRTVAKYRKKMKAENARKRS